jgi:hypothetical protein
LDLIGWRCVPARVYPEQSEGGLETISHLRVGDFKGIGAATLVLAAAVLALRVVT